MNSQVEKFNSRYAKKKTDEIVIKDNNLKQSTPEKQGEKIAKKHGISTEDIFAVITRESLEPFIKMWNNSMESVIRETIRTEIRQVIQEEMVSAYKGIMKGMMPEVDIDLRQQVSNIIRNELVSDQVTVRVKEEDSTKIHIDKKVTLEEAIILMKNNGIDPTVGVSWTKQGGRFATLYVTFMKKNKGIKGAWKEYVETVLSADEELN